MDAESHDAVRVLGVVATVELRSDAEKQEWVSASADLGAWEPTRLGA